MNHIPGRTEINPTSKESQNNCQ